MSAFQDRVKANGGSDGMVQGYGEMLTAKNEGMDMMNRPASRHDTPTTFREWCDTEFRPAVIG